MKLHAIGRPLRVREPIIGKISTIDLPSEARKDAVLFWTRRELPTDRIDATRPSATGADGCCRGFRPRLSQRWRCGIDR